MRNRSPGHVGSSTVVGFSAVSAPLLSTLGPLGDPPRHTQRPGRAERDLPFCHHTDVKENGKQRLFGDPAMGVTVEKWRVGHLVDPVRMHPDTKRKVKLPRRHLDPLKAEGVNLRAFEADLRPASLELKINFALEEDVLTHLKQGHRRKGSGKVVAQAVGDLGLVLGSAVPGQHEVYVLRKNRRSA